MSKKLKLTPWFPAYVAPARRGFYERRAPGGRRDKQYYTGSHWAVLPLASKLYNDRFSLQWRGLAVKP